jgi:hypothetical protein
MLDNPAFKGSRENKVRHSNILSQSSQFTPNKLGHARNLSIDGYKQTDVRMYCYIIIWFIFDVGENQTLATQCLLTTLCKWQMTLSRPTK